MENVYVVEFRMWKPCGCMDATVHYVCSTFEKAVGRVQEAKNPNKDGQGWWAICCEGLDRDWPTDGKQIFQAAYSIWGAELERQPENPFRTEESDGREESAGRSGEGVGV